MTANTRRWLSLFAWLVLIAIFCLSGFAATAFEDRAPVAKRVLVAVVALVGLLWALREFFGPPFDDARFERRVNREIARNRGDEVKQCEL